jgi:type I restriction enzyme, S subunit
MTKPEQTTLGELIEFQRGFDLPKSQFVQGKYPVQSSNGILGYHNKYKVEAPGISIGRSGTVGLPHLIKTNFYPHNTTLFVKDFKQNDVTYIYYLLKHLKLGDKKSGSGVPTMNRNHLHSLKVLAHKNYDSQRSVGKVLLDLDKKIELNNKINTELEVMAKLIYDYWFVQFDFPDVNGKPYKSSGGKMVYNETLKREIPNGWEVKELGELIEFERGISYKTKEIIKDGVPMINLNSFHLSGRYKHTGLKYFSGSNMENKICSTGDLVVAITDVTRDADIIGKSFTIPDLFDGGILISCDVAKVVSSDKLNKQFLEQLFNSKHYHNYIKYFASGTLVLHLNLDGVKWFKIPLPPVELLNKYSSLKQSFDEKITLSIRKNIKLSNLRDWLLPLLMNGQVSVKD